MMTVKTTTTTTTTTSKMELNTTSSTTKKKQKQVSFYGSVKCYLIEPITSKSNNNKSCYWYSEEEYMAFRNEMDTIQTSICDDKVPQTLFCIRGMEHIVDRKLCTVKRQRRYKSWDVVFDCQEQQWNKEMRLEQSHHESATAIASAYTQTTEDGTNEALQRAVQDQYEAQIVYTKNFMTTFSSKNKNKNNKKSVSFLEWSGHHGPIRQSQQQEYCPNIVAPRTA